MSCRLIKTQFRDGDIKDVDFRICLHLTHSNLYIATADSGHGFRFLPINGKSGVDMLEGKMSKNTLVCGDEDLAKSRPRPGWSRILGRSAI